MENFLHALFVMATGRVDSMLAGWTFIAVLCIVAIFYVKISLCRITEITIIHNRILKDAEEERLRFAKKESGE